MEVGDNLGPGRLGQCMGDCDSDVECAGDLVCSTSLKNGTVPGCVGVPEPLWEYCVNTTDRPAVGVDMDFLYELGDGYSGLGRCQGDW